jgi:hypothetical protein
MNTGRVIALTIFVLIASLPAISRPEEKTPPPLYPVLVNGKWGYINRQGKIAIKPQFDDAEDFFNGLAEVKIGERWTFINESGKTVFARTAAVWGSFSDGVICCIMRVGEGGSIKWGYMDKTGQVIIAPQFDYELPFSEGLAAVKLGEKWGFIDHSGELKIAPKFNWGGYFSDGLANIQINRKAYFIDESGKIVLETNGYEADPFSEGLAAVNFGGAWGYIDKTGKVVIKPQFKKAGSFSEGMAQVELNHNCGYIDNTGKIVIPIQFNLCHDFSEGLTSVRIDTVWLMNDSFYIDKKGNMAFNLYFSGAHDFQNGIARIEISPNSLYLIGQALILKFREYMTGEKSKYSSDSYFKIGYIDSSGNYVWPPQN